MQFSSLSQKQIAEALGVTPRSIRDWGAEGFPRKPDGSYELQACIQWAIAREVDRSVGPDGEEVLSLDGERARLAKEQADKHSLENAVRRGEVLELSIVEEAWAGLFTAVRARFLSLPTKVAAEVAAMTDANRVRDRLYDEVEQILRECSQYQPGSAAVDGEETGNRDGAGAAATAAPDGERVGGRKASAQPGKQRGAGSVEN